VVYTNAITQSGERTAKDIPVSNFEEAKVLSWVSRVLGRQSVIKLG
jgi:hypothetical protein